MQRKKLVIIGNGMVGHHFVEALEVGVHTGKNTRNIAPGKFQRLKMEFADGDVLETDLIVFSAGIRPRDELANAGAWG